MAGLEQLFAGSTNPVAQDWQRALVGQFPQFQQFPQDPQRSGLENFIRSLASNVLNIPQTTVAALQYPLRPPPAPTAPAPAAPATPGGLLGTPQVNMPARPAMSAAVPGTTGTTMFQFPTAELPTPPVIPPPPQQALPGTPDLTAVRGFLDQAQPKGPDEKLLADSKFAGILQGLARGAGSVSASEPGSFARALAMWGAGGQEGVKEGLNAKLGANERFNTATSQYYQNRASSEMQMQQLMLNAQNQQAMVNFENAKAQYQTDVANKKAMYDYELQKRGLQAPKVSMNAQGILIQQEDPKSGQTTVKFVDTTPTMQKLDSMLNVFKATNQPGAEALKIGLTHQMFNNPVIEDAIHRKSILQEVFQSGAGGAVFGPAYTNAVTQAQTELKKENPALLGDIKAYQAALQDRVLAKISQIPQIMTTNDWIKKAAAHSVTAAIISNSAPPPSLTNNVPATGVP